ncbi:MAG: phosphate ABC transporter substrate-binding protein [Candidatus Omnitrophica bacterium]|nr:phosphate ABC transporter substrate-binding protein [Candidatus Omnitrophota bacterium]
MKQLNKLLMIAFIAASFAFPCYASKIIMEGSTTVLPIAQRAAEVYMDNNRGVDISVRGGGSSVGIASLIDGTCDIADASRAIKSSELEKAISNGQDPVAHVVAMDGIAVIVNPSNKFSALSKKEVKAIFTGQISDWSQLGKGSGKIVAISRDSASGTYEAFGELVLEKQKPRADALLQASNQAVAQTVARTPGAIGYVGLGYVNSSVKALEIDGVMPSRETVLAGTYPVGRPLFMYTNGKPQGEIKDFMDFIKSAQGQEIAEGEGFVGLK